MLRRFRYVPTLFFKSSTESIRMQYPFLLIEDHGHAINILRGTRPSLRPTVYIIYNILHVHISLLYTRLQIIPDTVCYLSDLSHSLLILPCGEGVVVVYLILTDLLRIQPWSQDRRNQTKSNRKSEIIRESRQKRTDKTVASVRNINRLWLPILLCTV